MKPFWKLLCIWPRTNPGMNKGAFKLRQFALGLNYAEHGPLFSPELRPHMKPIAVSMYDWMHNFVVGGIFQVEMTELLKVLQRQGIPQSELPLNKSKNIFAFVIGHVCCTLWCVCVWVFYNIYIYMYTCIVFVLRTEVQHATQAPVPE